MKSLKDNLLLQFSVTAFIVLVVMGFILVVFLSAAVRSHAVESLANQAVVDSRSQLLSVIVPSDLVLPMTGERYDAFHKYVEESIATGGTAEIKLWGKDGTIIYSNNKSMVGLKFPGNDLFQKALRGETVSEIPTPEDLKGEGEEFPNAVMEVYTPIVFEGTTDTQGVFEIYEYYGPTAHLIGVLRNTLIVWVIIGSAVLYTSLVGIVWRGWRTIILQRKKRQIAEREMSQTKALVDAVVENAPLMISLKEASDLRYVLFNRAGEELLGYDRKAVLGKNNQDLFTPEQAALFMAEDREVLDGKTGLLDIPEEPVMTAGKGQRLLHTQKVRIEAADGTTKYLLSISEDITGRKQDEEDLKRNYETQKVIDSLLRLSLEDITLEEVLKKALDLILSIKWLTLESRGSLFLVEAEPDVLVMKAQSGLAEPILQACSSIPFGKCLCGRAAVTREVEFADCVDERHTVHYEGMPSHGHYCVPILFSDKVLGVINIYLKEGHLNEPAEKQFLKVVANTLAGVIARRQEQQKRQQMEEKAQISSRLAAVGEMAAGIAHEINNPLTSVIGFSELLIESPELSSDIKADLQIIADGSHRVKDIVRRMLTFARQDKPVRTSVSINELIEATLALRSYVLRTANIDIIKHLDPDLPLVVVDQGQMQQVFLNLIVNAEYSMKKAHNKGLLIITTERLVDHIRMSFRDDGTGMSQETKAKIFNPFFTTKDVGEGTGLGLGLSRSIILDHNGTIEVESEPGKGATFVITLPVSQATDDAESQQPAPNGNTSLENFRKAHILVVDDEDAIRTFLSTILIQCGHVVDSTGDAVKALAKMEQTTYDIIIADIRMPGMGGIELYSSIKEKHPGLASKVIFITGDTSDQNTRDFLEQNNLSYISKPFDRETLLKKVNGKL